MKYKDLQPHQQKIYIKLLRDFVDLNVTKADFLVSLYTLGNTLKNDERIK
jgi:hypothetical protein